MKVVCITAKPICSETYRHLTDIGHLVSVVVTAWHLPYRRSKLLAEHPDYWPIAKFHILNSSMVSHLSSTTVNNVLNFWCWRADQSACTSWASPDWNRKSSPPSLAGCWTRKSVMKCCSSQKAKMQNSMIYICFYSFVLNLIHIYLYFSISFLALCLWSWLHSF